MILKRLEVRHYRSIKDQSEDDCITFEGIDCLIGKNNAGKSNIIKAIHFLLNGESIEQDLFWQRDDRLEIDVRGYFQVQDADFMLLKTKSKRDNFREHLLEYNLIGICRRSSTSSLELIGLYPKEERLRPEAFTEVHSTHWADKASKAEFEQNMKSDYPELVPFLTKGKESNKSAWIEAYSRFCQDQPQGVEFVELPGPIPTGIPADFTSNMLPRVILVPAVKEVSEATRTTKSAELGSLLSELSLEVQEELDLAIKEALGDVYEKLNVILPDVANGAPTDSRIEGVRLIASEIFPNKVRGRALGISILMMWVSDAIVGQLMPVSLSTIGTAGTFWVFAGFCVIAFWVIYRLVPETKGKTLEEIQLMWSA